MEILNQMREAVANIGKQLAAEEQAQQAAAQQGQGQNQIDPKTMMALQKAQTDAQLKMQQANLDSQIKVADARQKMAIRDAETAQKLRQKKLA
jgi:hypothetical protein